MSWELILWIVSFFVSIGLLASNLYQIKGITTSLLELEFTNTITMLICLSDLEADHINPYDSASRINGVVVFEFLAQGMICALFLLTWHWFMFLLSAPVAYYHIRLYLRRKHLIDVTEIFSLLNGEKNLRFVKLGFYLVQFFIVIFRLVMVAVLAIIDEEDELRDGIF